uniref:Secreted protein n=1 Tax=Parastrongyloides trichosuri TaxID=131310 RepID=A0A0N4ZW57_PARTI
MIKIFSLFILIVGVLSNKKKDEYKMCDPEVPKVSTGFTGTFQCSLLSRADPIFTLQECFEDGSSCKNVATGIYTSHDSIIYTKSFDNPRNKAFNVTILMYHTCGTSRGLECKLPIPKEKIYCEEFPGPLYDLGVIDLNNRTYHERPQCRTVDTSQFPAKTEQGRAIQSQN